MAHSISWKSVYGGENWDLAILDLVTVAFNSVHSLRENRSQGSLFPPVKWKQRKCASRFISAIVSLWASLVAQKVKNLPAMWETWSRSLGWEDPLEEGMATHSSNSCLENHHGQSSLVGYSHGVEKPRPPSGRRTPLHQLQSQGVSCQGLQRDRGCHWATWRGWKGYFTPFSRALLFHFPSCELFKNSLKMSSFGSDCLFPSLALSRVTHVCWGKWIQTCRPALPAAAGLLHRKAASQSRSNSSLWGSSQGKWPRWVPTLDQAPWWHPLPGSCVTFFAEDPEGQNFLAKGTQLVSGWTRGCECLCPSLASLLLQPSTVHLHKHQASAKQWVLVLHANSLSPFLLVLSPTPLHSSTVIKQSWSTTNHLWPSLLFPAQLPERHTAIHAVPGTHQQTEPLCGEGRGWVSLGTRIDLPRCPFQGRDLGTRGVDSAYVWVYVNQSFRPKWCLVGNKHSTLL